MTRDLQYLDTEDHESHDDVMETAGFAAETFITANGTTVRISQAGTVFDPDTGAVLGDRIGKRVPA